jgi:cytochrome b
MVQVWDPYVRVFHWTLVAAYTVAWLTGEDLGSMHEAAGYVVGALVAARVVWGFVGAGHARFADFVYRPSVVAAYARDLVRFRAARHLGHSPAGGAMVVALLALLALTVATGLMTDDGEGERALLQPVIATAHADDAEGSDEDGERNGGVIGELHGALANISLILVFLHIGGVALASLVHRENLTRAMVTGDKRV